MKKIIAYILLFSLIASSCSITRNDKSIRRNNIFSNSEQKLIFSGKSNKPMRVLLINNTEDSLILRSQSKSFAVDTSDKALNHFVNRLYSTVRDSASMGVGIAAPQVGIRKKIIWLQRFDKKDNPFEVYFNPKINKYSELKQDVLEGCLSIPNVMDTTHYRSYAVLLEYDNKKGDHICEMIEAFTAVIFQHEIDHLNGILFTDHLNKERKESIKHDLK